MLKLTPVTLKTASDFIKGHHRHHVPTVGWKFGVGVSDGEKLVGVCVCSRPIARMLDDGWTLEVTRLATNGAKNACSILYGAARRAAFALGYTKIITYILESESGHSLKASGYVFERMAGGGSWSRPSRKRDDKAPLERKQLWSAMNKPRGNDELDSIHKP